MTAVRSVFPAALCVVTLFAVPPRAAADQTEGDVVWRIGTRDGSSDEFAAKPPDSPVFVVGKSDPRRDWPREQKATPSDPTISKIRFVLSQVPLSPLLSLDCVDASASLLVRLDVNGRKGAYHMRLTDLSAPPDTYDRMRYSVRMHVPALYLRRGENEIGISFLGEGGTVAYDALALIAWPATAPELGATVEPTIFYRRAGGELKELTKVTVWHRRPLGKVALRLHVGQTVLSATGDGGTCDFGDRVFELETQPVPVTQPYQLLVTAWGRTRIFRGEFRPQKRWRLFAVPQVHNDIGYTDLQANVQEDDARNTDAVIDIIGGFPFYKFNFETSWLVDRYLHARKPPQTQRLIQLAAKNQVGINAFYVHLLTGLCTGEELCRSLYFSKSLARKYGIPMRAACLTDVPSAAWFVPSLLADVGVKGFALGANQVRAPSLEHSNLRDESPFYWEGPDGRRVIAWYTHHYTALQSLIRQGLRRAVPEFLVRYQRKSYPLDAALIYGLYGDNANILLGGGQAQALAEWNAKWEFPKIITATEADFFDYIAEHFGDQLPVYRGDGGAYWEDGAASSASETALNRDSQRLLPIAEAAGSLAALFDKRLPYPAEEFRDAWNNVLLYDEHTWGAGNSVDQPDLQSVAEQWEVKRGYAIRAHSLAKELMTHSLNRLAQHIRIEEPAMLIVFNLDVRPLSAAMELELAPEKQLIDITTHQPIPVEIAGEKNRYRVVRFLAQDVPSLGYRVYGVRQLQAPIPVSQEPASNPWQIESRHYRVTLDPRSGAILELFDKDIQRQLVDDQAPNQLNELLYVSGGEDTSILRQSFPPGGLDIGRQSGASVVENLRTPLGQRIRVRAGARNIPRIDTEVTVYDELKRVDIVNRIRKETIAAKEAVYFAYPFRMFQPEIAYQGQSAWIRPNTDQLPGACRDWFATQNLVVARDHDAAIAWATPDAPLVTLTDINRGLWLRHLDVKNGHVFSYVMNNYWYTNYRASQGGDTTFRYFVTSGRTLEPGELARFDAETRPLVVGYLYDVWTRWSRQGLKPEERRMPAAAGSFLSIDAPYAQISTFKQAEDGNGYLLRLRETAGRSGTVRLKSPQVPLTAAFLCDGVEDDLLSLETAGGGVEVPLRPNAFTTIRLVF